MGYTSARLKPFFVCRYPLKEINWDGMYEGMEVYDILFEVNSGMKPDHTNVKNANVLNTVYVETKSSYTNKEGVDNFNIVGEGSAIYSITPNDIVEGIKAAKESRGYVFLQEHYKEVEVHFGLIQEYA